jgi:hypothetical protein
LKIIGDKRITVKKILKNEENEDAKIVEREARIHPQPTDRG